MSSENNDANNPVESTGSVQEARRAALKRLGIIGAYTAPAMLMLMHGKAAAQLTDSGCTEPDPAACNVI